MIKVNLLGGTSTARARVSATGEETAADTSFGTSAGITLQGSPTKKIAINLVILLIFPVALFFYEKQNIESLRKTAAAKQAEVSQLQQDLSAKQAEVGQSGALQEKAKELADKIGILNKLSKLRLREVKTLDFIQNVIPEKVWLKDLTLKEGAMEIKGNAVTDDDLNLFVRGLEGNRFFKDVLLLQAREEKGRDSSTKAFEITSKVEAE